MVLPGRFLPIIKELFQEGLSYPEQMDSPEVNQHTKVRILLEVQRRIPTIQGSWMPQMILPIKFFTANLQVIYLHLQPQFTVEKMGQTQLQQHG